MCSWACGEKRTFVQCWCEYKMVQLMWKTFWQFLKKLNIELLWKKVKVTQSCLTLCSLMDWSPPGSSVHGILQARILYWSGKPFPSSGDLPDPGTEPSSPTLQADSFLSEPELLKELAILGFPGGASGKEPTCQCRRREGLVPGLVRSPGGANGLPFQYSCLENPMDSRAWQLQSTGSQRVGHDWSDLAHTYLLMPKLFHPWPMGTSGWLLGFLTCSLCNCFALYSEMMLLEGSAPHCERASFPVVSLRAKQYL